MVKKTNPPNKMHLGCVHHWLCGDEQQGMVHAVCAKCAAVTDFAQHVYPIKWDKKDMTYLFSPRVRE